MQVWNVIHAFLYLSCLSYSKTGEVCLTNIKCAWKKTKDLCKLHLGVNKALKRALHKQITLLSVAESTKPWLPPLCPKALFIIGAFSDLIWKSRMEIPHPGIFDLLECAHEGTQGAFVPALLVLGALFKWHFFSSIAHIHIHHLTKNSTLSIRDPAVPLSTITVACCLKNKNI